MAKKKEMVSVSKLDEVIKEQYGGVVTAEIEVDWHGVKFNLRVPLSLSDTIQISEEVSSNCFLDDGRFVPEIRTFLLRRAIVEHCTNIRLPQSAEKQYDLLMNTDLFDEIVYAIGGDDLVDDLEDAISEKIDYLRDMQLSTERMKLNELIAQFSTIAKNLESLFGGVTNDDLKNMIGAIGKSGVDPEKLMSEYLERRYGAEEKREEGNVIDFPTKEE